MSGAGPKPERYGYPEVLLRDAVDALFDRLGGLVESNCHYRTGDDGEPEPDVSSLTDEYIDGLLDEFALVIRIWDYLGAFVTPPPSWLHRAILRARIRLAGALS